MKKRPPSDLFFAPRSEKPVPHAFVLDALASLEPYTRPMFGCTAVYVEEKIVLVLRGKAAPAADNGVWLATTVEHHASLRRELPSLRSIAVLGAGVTGWQMLPEDEPGFEDEALRAAALILEGDPRIGKVPKPKRPKAPKVMGAPSAPKAKVAPTRKKRVSARG